MVCVSLRGNSCSRVLKGLLQTFILCFLRVLDRGSVIPLIYGSVAYPAQDSEGSIGSKNVLTNSSGLGVAFSVWVLITLEIIISGIHLIRGLRLRVVILSICRLRW